MGNDDKDGQLTIDEIKIPYLELLYFTINAEQFHEKEIVCKFSETMITHFKLIYDENKDNFCRCQNSFAWIDRKMRFLE